MNNVTKKYALFMLKEKRKLYDSEIASHLFVSMIVEMMLDGNLEITNKNKVKIIDKLPTENYNRKLYEIIKEMKKDEVPFRDIIISICCGFTNKKMKDVVELLKENMEKDELIKLENKKGLIGNKEVITINEDKFSDIVGEMRTEFLEKGSLSEDIILLASLLNSTRFLKNIFTKYEKECLKDRLNEIKNTEIAKRVKVAESVINDMYAILGAIMATSVN